MDNMDEVNRQLRAMWHIWQKIACRVKHRQGVDEDMAVAIVVDGVWNFLVREAGAGVSPLEVLERMGTNSLESYDRTRLWWSICEAGRKQRAEERRQTRWRRSRLQAESVVGLAAKSDSAGKSKAALWEAIQRLRNPFQEVVLAWAYGEEKQVEFRRRNNLNRYRWKILLDEGLFLLADKYREVTRERVNLDPGLDERG